MAMMDGMTGIVMGSVFGGIFILTCLLSTIKAVRDRKRIKKNIAEREKLRIDSGTSGSDIEEKQTTPVQGQSTVNGITNNCVPVPYIDGDSPVRTTTPQAQVYCVSDGVDNLTFKHSHADIKSSTNSNSTNDTPRVKQNYHLKSNAKSVENVRSTVNSNSSHVPKRTLTSTETNGDERGNGLRHLPPDCLAVRKTARRYSYEIAVGEHSWLPVEMPNFASSETIMNTYTYGGGTAPHAKSTIGFENRAYDDGYYKKPRLLVKKL